VRRHTDGDELIPSVNGTLGESVSRRPGRGRHMANLHANVLQIAAPGQLREWFAMLTERSARLLNLTDYGLVAGNSVVALCALLGVGAPTPAAAQALTTCTVGQAVTDREDKTGVIVSAGNNLCQVEYPDGQVYGWIYWNLRPAPPNPPGLPKAGTATPGSAVPPANNAAAPTILRAAPAQRSLLFRADRRGHVMFTAIVNGTPIRFLVDTGASRVTLTAEDARAAGIDRGGLVFNQRSQTANGMAREAPVTLREIRIDRLSIDNVSAAVNENLTVSLLGMSFLGRLKSFEMRDGSLTISW
jgi:aspartyl protease family protein